MHLSSLLSAGLVAASAVTASPAMTPSRSMRKRGGSGDQVVVYWGNTGSSTGNIPLSEVCSNDDVDIVVLSFLTEFPDQASGGVPVLNFGNACGNTFSSGLLHCSDIGTQVTACKSAGKKVLLSLGGAYPANQAFTSATTAESFADWLWYSFGPNQNNGFDRPFDDAVIDGFDLDIESSVAESQKQAYFPDFIAELRSKYAAYGGSWYISAAPQCVVPDSHFSSYIQSSWFDFIFVQLYNTDGCSARDLVDTPALSTNTFSDWLSGSLSSTTGYANSAIQVFAGLPASTVASTGTSSGSRFYLAPSEVKTLVQGFYQIAAFGGISLWDATYDAQNLICGKSYSYWVKKALSECYSGNFSPFPSACASSSSSSSIASSTSSVFSSSSSYVISTTSSTISSSSSVVSSSTSSHVSSSSSSYSAHPSSSYSAHPTTSKASTSSLSFPSHGPYTNSSTVSFSATKPGGGDSGPHQSNSNGGDHGSGPSSSIGGFPGSKASSSGADGGYWSHPKPTATKTSTSTYVDVCPTGLTTKTHTWTKTCYEGDDSSATTTDVPDGWTVTVTVCTACGTKPTTVTVTKPWDPPAGKPTGGSWPQGGEPTVTSTMVVIVTPVPESVYWGAVGKPVPSTPVAPVIDGAKPSSGSWFGSSGSGASPNAGSSVIAKPVAGSPTNAASWALGTGASYGSKTGSSAAQFTGAASKMNVGLGLFGGLALAVLAAF